MHPLTKSYQTNPNLFNVTRFYHPHTFLDCDNISHHWHEIISAFVTSYFSSQPIQIFLQFIHKSSNMYTIYKRMVCLNRHWHNYPPILFVIFPPVKQRCCIIFLTGIGMGNMSVCYPRHRRTLKYIYNGPKI